MIDLKLPKINGETIEERMRQTVSYLHQHVEELDYTLNQIQNYQENTNTALEEISNSDNGINTIMSKVSKLGKQTTQIKADADGIKASVTTLSTAFGELKSEYEQTAEQVKTTVSAVNGLTTAYSEIKQTVGEISSTVSGISDDVGELSEGYSQISQTVGSIVTTVSGHTEAISSINGSITTLTTGYTSITQKVGEIDSVVSGQSSSINTMQGSITTLSSGYSEISQTVGGISSTVSGFTETIDTLTGNVVTLTSGYTDITQTVGSITSTVSGLEYDNGQLKEGFSQITQTINGISSTVTGHGNRLDSVEGDLLVIGDDYVVHSELEATKDEILLKVSEEIDGEVAVYDIDYVPNNDTTAADYYLYKWPACDFTENLVCTDEEQDEELFICTDFNPKTFEYPAETMNKHITDIAFYKDKGFSYRFMRTGDIYYWNAISDGDFGIAMSRIGKLEVKSDEIKATVDEQIIVINDHGDKLVAYKSIIDQHSDDITAKVSKVDGDSTTSCSWNLSTDAFKVNSNGNEVLKVDGTGLHVNGSGTFSGTISSNSANITGGRINIETALSDASSASTITLKNKWNGNVATTSMYGDGISSSWESSNSNNKFYADFGATGIDFRLDDGKHYTNVYANRVHVGYSNITVEGYNVLTTKDVGWKQMNTTPLTHGNTISFSASGYNTLLLEGYTAGGNAFQMMTVPIATLSSSARIFAITMGSTKLIAQLTLVANTVSVKCLADNSTGAWAKVWLQK